MWERQEGLLAAAWVSLEELGCDPKLSSFSLGGLQLLSAGEGDVGRGEAEKVLRGCCRGTVKGQVPWGWVVRGRWSLGGNS